MITKADIKQETNSVSYNRGKKIYEEQKVHAFQVQEMEDIFGYQLHKITAVVDGSGKNMYCVSVSVDEEMSEIMEDDCDCPAHEQYWGLCKHCVAVLLYYLEWRKKERKKLEEKVRNDEEHQELEQLLRAVGVKKGMEEFQGEHKIVRKVVKPTPKAETSPGFSELLSHYVMRDQVAFLPKAKAGQVKLEIHLESQFDDSFRAEFKIGSKRMYVLKSVSKMTAAVKNMETVSYGAQLSFLHCMDAFEEESRPMVEFLSAYTMERGSCYQIGTGSYASCFDDRYVMISVQNMDEFFEAVGSQEFFCRTNWREEKLWHCQEGMPQYEMKLLRKADGLKVQMYADPIFYGRKYLYFLSEKNTIYRIPREEIAEVCDFLEYMERCPDGVCEIAKEDIPTFCQGLLPVLEEHFKVKKEEKLELQQYLPPQVEFQIYLDAPQHDMITCELLAVYGEKKYNVFADANDIHQLSHGRDVRKEAAANQLVRSCFSAYDARKHQMLLQGADEMYEFLSSGMEDLQKLGEIFVSDRLKAIRVIPSPKVSVGVSLAENVLELHLNPGNFDMEELAEILSKYDRKKKFYRLRTGEFMDMDEDGIRVLSELRENLQISEAKLKSGEITIPKYRALYLDTRLKEQDDLQVEKNREFRMLIRNMKTAEENDFELPDNLQAQLREYQKTGFWWLKTLCQNGFGGILADDMGLGKTLQTIAFLLSEMQEAPEDANRRSLIVAPASLVYNWESECARFAPELQTRLVAGTQEQRKEMIQNAGMQDILITSYDLLRRDIELYQDLPFFCEIIDEAQFIKNHATQGAKAVKTIHASFRLALTGTPVENQLSELWSIFDYLMPGFLYGYQKFREQFELPIVRNGDEERLERLQKMIRPFILRRLKKEVLKDLPDKIEKNMAACMEQKQKELYHAHAQRLALMLQNQTEEEFADSRFQVLSELTRLRQLCCDPALVYENYEGGSAKLDLCIELIQSAVESGHKILLFSQFTSMIEILTARLQEESISCFVLQGSTKKEQRAQMVEQFNRDDTSVFCISLKAGGTGLNLTGADIVIHYDPWWNVAVENQATDRAHRIGQKNVVTVYKLIAKGTIEEKIIKLQQMKKELAEEILSGDEIKTASFQREELLELLEEWF